MHGQHVRPKKTEVAQHLGVGATKNVAAKLGVKHPVRICVGGPLGVEHHGKLGQFHGDQGGGLIGQPWIVGDHHSDRLAGETHAVERKHALCGDIARSRQIDRWQFSVGRNILARQHQADPGRVPGRIDHNAAEHGMGRGRANDRHVQHARGFEVGHEARLPEQQPPVFPAWNGGSDQISSLASFRDRRVAAA